MNLGPFLQGRQTLLKKDIQGSSPGWKERREGQGPGEDTPIIAVGVSVRQALVEVLDENELDHPACAVIFLLQEPWRGCEDGWAPRGPPVIGYGWPGGCPACVPWYQPLSHGT